MMAHHKMSPQEQGVQNYTWPQKMAIHINTCPFLMQAYENKTLHMLDKTIDDERQELLFFFLAITCAYAISYKNSWHT
jgi:hypothetical protein